MAFDCGEMVLVPCHNKRAIYGLPKGYDQTRNHDRYQTVGPASVTKHNWSGQSAYTMIVIGGKIGA